MPWWWLLLRVALLLLLRLLLGLLHLLLLLLRLLQPGWQWDRAACARLPLVVDLRLRLEPWVCGPCAAAARL